MKKGFYNTGARGFVVSTHQILEIRNALLETYFKGCWAGDNSSEEALREIDDHVRGRFDLCRSWLVPWIKRYIDLSETDVIEIGCGTGSTTAAVALDARHVDAYDIADASVETARRRIDILGLRNVNLHSHAPDLLLESLQHDHRAESTDCIILFAVLEHMLICERLETLRTCWHLLRPGGILVIGDTPNRLSPFDYHTARLPFFEWLPEEIAVRYAAYSDREDFCEELARNLAISEEAARETLARRGRGVSYHEFEIALGDVVRSCILGDGFDPEPLSYFGVPLETRILYTYASKKNLNIPAGFLRATIELILAKPGGEIRRATRTRKELDAIVHPLVDSS